MTLCPLEHHDDKPTRSAPGLILCWGHRNKIEDDIELLPVLYHELALQLRPAGRALQPYTTGTGEAAPYINGAVADHRDLIWAGLSALARVIVEDRGVTAPDDSHPDVTSRFLLAHVDWISAQPFADDEAANLRDLVRRGFSLAYPSGTRRIHLRGPDGKPARCVEDVDEARCTGTLTANITVGDELLPATIRCDTCGSEVEAAAWRTFGLRWRRLSLTSDDEWLPIANAADLLDRPFRTVQGWYRDNLIASACRIDSRRIEVLVADAARMAREADRRSRKAS